MVRGTNASLMKENNRRLILDLIRREKCSRADLAKRTRLTKATVTILVEELLRDGLLREESAEDYAGVGRRPMHLRLCADARYTVGFGLTRTEYQAGLFNLAGEAVCQERRRYGDASAEETLTEMAALTETYRRKIPADALLGVGVAGPGPVDYKTGVILNPPNFDKWRHCGVQARLSALCGLPVRVENIANAMAMEEQYFGDCLREANFAYVVADEGIGSGIVVDGKLYRGQRGFGSELGHISIAYEGRPCPCGNRGCLERYASIPAILEGSRYGSWQEAVDAGDQALIGREAAYLACGLVSLLNLFDLGTVVLGGDIAYGGETLARLVQDQVQARALVRHPVRVIPARTQESRARAAASAALHELFYSR